MTPECPKRKMTIQEFVALLERLVEKALQTDRWEVAASGIKAGIERETSRIPTFCLLSGLILRKLFFFGESEEAVHGFLVEKLGLESGKAALVALMAIDAGKKAVDVIEDGKLVDAAVRELHRDHKADPALARPMIEAAVKLLESLPG